MSENSEVARRGFEAWSRGDWKAVLADMDPEIEWHVSFRLPDLPPEKTVYRGHEELQQLWNAFTEVWDTLRVDVEELLHDADDQVILRCRFVGLGESSGIEVDRRIYYLLVIRDLKLTNIRPFDSEAEARRAAGIDA
jgi:ketosteroid isomerase-like protein